MVADFRDSISGLDTKRPKYLAMIEAFERQEAFHLILWESQRFGRDELEFIERMSHLMDIGVTIHDTDKGVLSREDVARLAYEAGKEAWRNSRRTYSKQRLKARKGQPQSRLPRGLMYEYDHDEKGDRIKPGRVVMDPKAGPAVQRAFRNYLATKSVRVTTDRLNAELGIRMSVRGVSRLLQNRLLKGVYVWGRRNCGRLTRKLPRTPDDWEFSRIDVHLIDDDTFDAVQFLIGEQNNHGYDKVDGRGDLLTGLLWCGACNNRMHGTTKRGWNGYTCDVCFKTRSMKQIDQAVLEWMKGVDYAPLWRDVNPAAGDEQDGLLAGQSARLDQELADITAERVELTRQFTRRQIEARDYHATLTVLEQEQAQREAERTRIEAKRQELRGDAAVIQQVLAGLQQLQLPIGKVWAYLPGHQRDDVKALVDRIVWDRTSDTLVIEWKAALARHLGAEQQTVEIGAPKSGPNSKSALELAAANPGVLKVFIGPEPPW